MWCVLYLGVLFSRRSFIASGGCASISVLKACAEDESAIIAATPSKRCLNYYGPIESKSLLSLNSLLTNMADESDEPIHLHVQSGGGELVPALYTSDLIISLPVPIHTYVDGFCASAATLLSTSGDVRHMSKKSIFMIHQLSTGHSGKYIELIQSMSNSEMLMDKLVSFYMERSKLQRNTLDELLKTDKYLDASTCYKYGLIDIIAE